MDWVVDAEFEERIPADAESEGLLADDIRENGGKCDQKLKLCEFPDGGKTRRVLFDGHRRLKVCSEHGFEYEVSDVVRRFESREAALLAMDHHYVSLRWLSRRQRQVVLTRLHNAKVNIRELSEKTGMTKSTIGRAVQVGRALERLAEKVRKRAEQGEFSDDEVKQLVKLDKSEQQRAVKQVDSGEFGTVSEAIRGEEDLGCSRDEKSEAVADWRVQKTKALNTLVALQREVDELDRQKKSPQHKKLVEMLYNVSHKLNKW